MGYIFHKMNKEVLSFDCILDNEKILFNHYIMRKVNLNNMKNELEKNHFKISTRTASSDLNISLSKTHRMLKEFESLNIIKCIRLGDRKGKCSIYKYITDDETVFETVIKNKVERVKYCHIDNLKHINEMDKKSPLWKFLYFAISIKEFLFIIYYLIKPNILAILVIIVSETPPPT